MLIVFDDIIADMISNKQSMFNPIVTEIFIRGRKLNIFSCLNHRIKL